MTPVQAILLVLSVLLFCYLGVALLKPESF